MNTVNFKVIICLILSVAFLSACTPSSTDISLYTTDVELALEGEVIEVPIKATFSLFGEDEAGDLDKAIVISKKYLAPDSVFSQSSGDWGDKLVIETTIPLGINESLNNYLNSNKRIVVLLVERVEEYQEINVSIRTTELATALDSELSEINFMLGFSLPADDTNFRIISDSRSEIQVGATAVFVSEKPYLYFSKTLERRDEAEIVFKGGTDSVYSEIEPVIYFADQF